MSNEDKKNNLPKLPATLNTDANRRFFDATINQLLSPKDSEKVNAFIGRRTSGAYDPSDYYLEEQSKERTWYHLEPLAYSKNPVTLEDTNHYFYDDIVSRIKYLGGLTNNHDRLFSGQYYSFSPAIDYDKFINYTNYYWVQNRLPVIEISGLDDTAIESEIVGKLSYMVPETAEPAGLTFTSGLRVKFTDADAYNQNLTIEGVGRGILLLPDYVDGVATQRDDYIPWDDSGFGWDMLRWDSVQRGIEDDYMTIERGAYDENAWSRSNKWYHKEVINLVNRYSRFDYSNASRAQRPIIEFKRNIEIYNGGNRFIGEINNMTDTPFSEINGKTLSETVNLLDGNNPVNGNTMVFGNPPDSVGVGSIFRISLSNDDDPVVTLTEMLPKPSSGDTIVVKSGVDYIRQSFVYSSNSWNKITYDKEAENQAPLFNLYDALGVYLGAYSSSQFSGNELFSYKVNESSAFDDPILGFPLEYGSIGQASDIVFESDIINEKYYSDGNLIEGYYYYRELSATPLYLTQSVEYNARKGNDTYVPRTATSKIENFWQTNGEYSKQYVIDHFVTTKGKSDYPLSASPRNGGLLFDKITVIDPVVKVTLDGKGVDDFTVVNRKNNFYVVLGDSVLYDDSSTMDIKTYTWGAVGDNSRGYFEIPQQLENNPNYNEITENTATDLTSHFVSAMANQENFVGSSLGGSNNYRDTAKDETLGDRILQNQGSMLKSMLISSSESLDIIESIRFSQREYVRFKNKFNSQIDQLTASSWKPFIASDSTVIDVWMSEILERISNTTEYQGAFLNSFMIANGNVFESFTFPAQVGGSLVSIASGIDPYKHNNFLYLYDGDRILVNSVDYIIESFTGSTILIRFIDSTKNSVTARLFDNPVQDAIPATPSKLGCFYSYAPEIFLDSTFITPRMMMRGHDGSTHELYGGYENGELTNIKDRLMFELEVRIYNNLDPKFQNPTYKPLLEYTDILEGRYRQYIRKYPSTPNREGVVRYSREEFVEISKSLFYKWANINNANFRSNDFFDKNNWKTWNYSDVVHEGRNLDGHWKGIYRFYFDTDEPDIAPWEMLGFQSKPLWWESEYGAYPYTPDNEMWVDIENGYIRDGDRKGVADHYVREGLTIPVDENGEILPIFELFGINDKLSNQQKAKEWKYGDCAPVEDAWLRSSDAPFSLMEVLFLMRPANFGEVLWDTLSTSDQFAVNNEFVNSVNGTRDGNSDLIVHGENTGDELAYRAGYQQWISDRLTFNLRNLTTDFGDVVRGLDVELGHKLGGFTNENTLNVFIEGTSTTSISDSLQIPQEDVSVKLFTGATQHTYVANGVLVRIVDANKRKYQIQGYDLLDLSFKTLKRDKTKRPTPISVGGTEATYRKFLLGQTYTKGEYVLYETNYYKCLVSHTATIFDDDYWKKLPSLPMEGGFVVDYYPYTTGEVVEVQYNHVYKSEQDLFDFLISYGQWLESEGWKFEYIDTNTNIRQDWVKVGKDFLFWASSAWSTDNSIILFPRAEELTLEVKEGYPSKIERTSNGVYSLLNKGGFAISPNDTLVDRDDRKVVIRNKDDTIGIYQARVSTKETEHIVTFNNVTEFNDVIYDPLLGTRQQRLRYNGFRTKDWIGKLSAGGYLVTDSGMTVNYENLTDSISKYHDTESSIDLPQFDLTAKHLIGYENRDYMDNLEIIDDTQYQFYQGMIREKGTINSIDKLLRASRVAGEEGIDLLGEWAFKVGEYGATNTNMNLEFLIRSGELRADPQVLRLHTDLDGHVVADDPNDSIIDVDIDDNTRWLKKPESIYRSEEWEYFDDDGNPITEPRKTFIDDITWFPTVDVTDNHRYDIPNAGYVHAEDIDVQVYDLDALFDAAEDGTLASSILSLTDLILDNLIDNSNLYWVASDSTERWGVYSMFDNSAIRNLSEDENTGFATVTVDYDNFTGLRVTDKQRRYLETFFDASQEIVYQGVTNIMIVKSLDLPVLQHVGLYYYEYDADTKKYILQDRDRNPIVYADVFGDIDFDSVSGGENDEIIQYNVFINQRFFNKGEMDTYSGHAINKYAWIDNTGATAYVGTEVKDGTIGTPVVEAGGIGYTEALGYVIDNGFGAEFDISYSGENGGRITEITVVKSGKNYNDDQLATAIIVGDGNGAEIHITQTDGEIDAVVVDNGGSGYSATRTNIIFPSSNNDTADEFGQGADVDLIVTEGVITDVILVDDGENYENPYVEVQDGGAFGATAIGYVDGIGELTPRWGGSGYTADDVDVVIAAPESEPTNTAKSAQATAVIEGIGTITIEDGGQDYIDGKEVSIESDGTGTGAEAIMHTVDGTLSSIDVIDNGRHYSHTVDLIIESLDGQGATAVAIMDNGLEEDVELLTSNERFVQPTITVQNGAGHPDDGGSGATFDTSVMGIVDQITVSDGGNDYSNKTTVVTINDITGSTGDGATATAVIVGRIQHIHVDDGGSGYSDNVEVEIIEDVESGYTGTGATAVATVTEGVVTSVTVTSMGSGYNDPSVIFTDVGGDGSPHDPDNVATATAIVVGEVDKITMDTVGDGYTTVTRTTDSSAPVGVSEIDKNVTVTVSSTWSDGSEEAVEIVGSGVVATGRVIGTVTGIKTITSGEGYNNPITNISEPVGTGGVATAKVTAINSIVGVDLVSRGFGYDDNTLITVVTNTEDHEDAQFRINLADGMVDFVEVIANGRGYKPEDTITVGFPDGTGALGTAVIDAISGYTITESGYGYGFTETPHVSINSVYGTGASAGSIVSAVGHVEVINGGIGYDTILPDKIPNVNVYGDGIGASYEVEIENDVISGITRTKGGSGYVIDRIEVVIDSVPPAYNNPPIEEGENGFGAIIGVTSLSGAIKQDDTYVVESGYGYTSTPLISVTDTTGDGYGAIIEAVMSTDNPGEVKDINVIEMGQNYETPIIVVDSPNTDGEWEVYRVGDETPYRKNEPLIDTKLYKNGFMYDYDTEETIQMLPVFDPFKGIINGQCGQNLSYMRNTDPSKYTNSSDLALIDENSSFDEQQIGELWWDLSTCRFMYYEQGDVNYRRAHWGEVFTGSSIDVYEWVSSSKSPSEWDLDGTPKNTTDYVYKRAYNALKSKFEGTYYFWVKGRTKIPDSVLRRNRTMSALDVSRGIYNPKLLGFSWFSPISHSEGVDNDNAYIFSNIGNEINNRDVAFQVNYQTKSSDTKVHTEWKLLREGDTRPEIPTFLWAKMVDSLVGYIDIQVPDIDGNGDATGETNQIRLTVPDPLLSEVEKYGTQFRPRQTWFKEPLMARQIFVEVANRLLKEINIRDTNPNWDANVPTQHVWNYVDWYADGYDFENVIASREVETRNEIDLITDLRDGDIIRVTEDRYTHFLYSAVTDSLTLINRQDSAIELLDVVFADDISVNFVNNDELRLLLEALRTQVFVGEYEINTNLLFFSMINYVVSEQNEVDWFFKTTYLKAIQDGKELTQERNYRSDAFTNTLDYINEVKPYHSKVREFEVSYTVSDVVSGTVEDSRTDKVIIKFNRVCETQVENVISRLDKVSGGTGYINQPTLKIIPHVDDKAGMGATGYAYLGGLGTITIDNVGSGYSPSVEVVVDPEKNTDIGEGAIIKASVTSGRISKLTVVSSGSGFKPNDDVVLKFIDPSNTSGNPAVASVKVDAIGEIGILEVGMNYDLIPTVVIVPNVDDINAGGATAVANVEKLHCQDSECSFIGTIRDGGSFGDSIGWDEIGWDDEQWDGNVDKYIDVSNEEDWEIDLYDRYTPVYKTDDYEIGELLGNESDVRVNDQDRIEVMRTDVVSDGGSFLQPGWSTCQPEEFVPFTVGETFSMIVDSFYEDKPNPVNMSYRVLYNSHGVSQFYRNADHRKSYIVANDTMVFPRGATLGDINAVQLYPDNVLQARPYNYDEIYVEDIDKYVTTQPIDYAWIGHEKISYTGTDALESKLTGVMRGVDGTSHTAHQTGTPIIYAGVTEVIPNPEYNFYNQIVYGNSAILDIKLGNGAIESIGVSVKGTGYTEETTTITVMPDANDPNIGNIEYAVVEAIIHKGGISSLNIVNGGSGYTKIVGEDGTIEMEPTVVITGGDGNAVAGDVEVLSNSGSIVSVDVIHGGNGYLSSSRMMLDETGDGKDATVFVNTDNGVITSIDLTDAGSGYETPYILLNEPDDLNVYRDLYDSADDYFSIPKTQQASYLRSEGGTGTVGGMMANMPLVISIDIDDQADWWMLSPIISGGKGQDDPTVSWRVVGPTGVPFANRSNGAFSVGKTTWSNIIGIVVELTVTKGSETTTTTITLKNTENNDDK